MHMASRQARRGKLAHRSYNLAAARGFQLQELARCTCRRESGILLVVLRMFLLWAKDDLLFESTVESHTEGPATIVRSSFRSDQLGDYKHGADLKV